MGSRIGILKIAAKKVGVDLATYLARIDSGLKCCMACREWKPIEAFGSDSTRYDKRSSRCLDCCRVKVRKSTKGRVSTFRGRTHSAVAKARMSTVRKGRPGPRKGQTLSEEEKRRISEATRKAMPKGAGCWWTWKGGVMPANLAARGSSEYADWRKAVFARDRYTCQKCGDNKGGNLNAHHIKPFATHHEFRFDVSNGVTLCEECHEEEHRDKARIRA